MTAEAPKRIWVEDCNSDWSTDSGTWGASWENDWDVEYVRADIADDMLEALKALTDINDNGGPFGGEVYQDRVDRAWDAASAAIAKAEGTTE